MKKGLQTFLFIFLSKSAQLAGCGGGVKIDRLRAFKNRGGRQAVSMEKRRIFNGYKAFKRY